MWWPLALSVGTKPCLNLLPVSLYHLLRHTILNWAHLESVVIGGKTTKLNLAVSMCLFLYLRYCMYINANSISMTTATQDTTIPITPPATAPAETGTKTEKFLKALPILIWTHLYLLLKCSSLSNNLHYYQKMSTMCTYQNLESQ